jgi:hypothetical protein
VRIQWDPERSEYLDALPWRAIQIGLGGEAADRYLAEWIVSIEDVTPAALTFGGTLSKRHIEFPAHQVPRELPYPLGTDLARRIGASSGLSAPGCVPARKPNLYD